MTKKTQAMIEREVRRLNNRVDSAEGTQRLLARVQVSESDKAEKLRKATLGLVGIGARVNGVKGSALVDAKKLAAMHETAKSIGPFRIHPKMREYAKTGRVTKARR